MSRRLILDGYNIINLWSGLKVWKDESLDLARKRLIEMMSDYQAYSGDEVTIVFDGAKIEGVKEEEEVLGVKVIFAKPPLSADSLIERLAYKDIAPSSLKVVTSDIALRNFVLGLGISWSSPRDLEKEVLLTLDKMRKEHMCSKKHLEKKTPYLS